MAGIPKTDITGKTVGKLKVIKYAGRGKWACLCSCGNPEVKYIDTRLLVNGTVTNCGCERKLSSTKFKDLTGQTFGDWEVIEYAGNQKWKCRCKCELHTERIVDGRSLRNGTSTGCGHKRLELEYDLVGKRFGEWTVLKYVGDQNYLCRCSCENKTEKIINGRTLRRGNTRSCGCKKKSLYQKSMLARYGDISYWKANNNRTDKQIKATKDKDTMLEYINELGGFPTIHELSQVLGVNETMVLRYIHNMGLENTVNINPLKSKGEAELVEFVKSIYNGTVILGDREILSGKELDIVLPELKIALEFNGTFWHNYLIKGENYHINKTIACGKLRYRLIHIYEHEWELHKDKIKEYLISVLCSNEKLVYARNTEVIEVDTGAERDILNRYHLQGYTASKICYGLKYDNKIIGLMSFGKPRFNTGAEWELIRFVWVSGYKVIGGAEKLFNAFVSSSFKPKSIVTYSNIDKFTGEIYQKLGFKRDSKILTKPNYVWVSNHNKSVLTRYQTMKSDLVAKGLGSVDQTENEIMEQLGYYKIYDCGNFIFIWERDKE